MTDQELLRRLPLFSRLDEEELNDVVELMERRTFPAGTTISEEGEPGDYFYVITSGVVEFVIRDAGNNPIVVDDASTGDFFGELSMITGEPRYVSVRAVEDTEVLGLGHAVFFDMLLDHPHSAIELLTILGRRLLRTDKLLRETVSRNVNELAEQRSTFGERVADHFAELAGSWSFIIIQSVILAIWVLCNMFLPKRWDPYPFVFLNLLLSFQAAYAAPIIMMSQNRASDKDRLAAEVDHDVNVKAEIKTGLILSRLDELERIVSRLGKAKA